MRGKRHERRNIVVWAVAIIKQDSKHQKYSDESHNPADES
jgi:hypothetical protein